MSGDGIPPCMGGDLGFLVRMGGLAGIWGSTYTGGFGVFIGILGFCGDEGLGGGVGFSPHVWIWDFQWNRGVRGIWGSHLHGGDLGVSLGLRVDLGFSS